uniref:Uncharacterized protein n=1 Tax=Oryzias sinensis TaxID=183150 RepID=A0A8C8DMZ1_9TELE
MFPECCHVSHDSLCFSLCLRKSLLENSPGCSPLVASRISSTRSIHPAAAPRLERSHTLSYSTLSPLNQPLCPMGSSIPGNPSHHSSPVRPLPRRILPSSQTR